MIKNDPDLVKSWRVDQILTSELFSYPSLRDQQTEKLFRQRDSLLAKVSRSASEEARLRRLEKKIASLDIAEDQEDLKAMELIRKAAALIKKDKRG